MNLPAAGQRGIYKGNETPQAAGYQSRQPKFICGKPRGIRPLEIKMMNDEYQL
jgi:hypothetical protein